MSENVRLYQLIGDLSRHNPALAGAFVSLTAKIDVLVEENRANKAAASETEALRRRLDSLMDLIYAEAGEHEPECFCWMCKELRREAITDTEGEG